MSERNRRRGRSLASEDQLDDKLDGDNACEGDCEGEDDFEQEDSNESSMFIPLGIIIFVAGLFVFQQASTIVRFETLAAAFGGANSIMGIMFTAVSVLLIAAGVCSFVSTSGKKRGLIKASAWMFAIAAALAVANYSMGDMKIWTYVCAGLSALYFIWLWRNPEY